MLSLGIAALTSANVGLRLLTPEAAVGGLVTVGVPVLMILSTLTITGEFRTGMIRTTFMATPNRTLVLGAKAVVAAVFSATVAVVTGIAAMALAKALADQPQLSLTNGDSWRTIGAIALYAALAAVLAVSLGALLRHAAAAITILLLWPFVVEPLLSSIPRVGDRVSPFLPFINAYEFIGSGMYRDDRLLWGPVGALLYFVGFVAVLLVAGAFVTSRRDP